MKVELVTNLKRQATKILADLHKSKEAVLITEPGQPIRLPRRCSGLRIYAAQAGAA